MKSAFFFAGPSSGYLTADQRWKQHRLSKRDLMQTTVRNETCAILPGTHTERKTTKTLHPALETN